MNQIIVEALKSLSIRVNVSTGLAHPLDSDSAKELFNILKRNGQQLVKTEIEVWATQNGWAARHASELGELGEKIGAGGRVQIKNKNRWKEGVYEDWLSRARDVQS